MTLTVKSILTSTPENRVTPSGEALLVLAASKPREAQPEPFAFVQEVDGYAQRLFLASEFPDMMTRDWAEGVTIRPLVLAASPPPASTPYVPLSDMDISDAYVKWDRARGSSYADLCRAIERIVVQRMKGQA